MSFTVAGYEGRELPAQYVYYTRNEAGEYAQDDDRVDERLLVLCHAADNTCSERAVNYSGRCIRHGGQYGPDAMSRLEKFRRGYIGVKDLDYEELRDGVTRGNKGNVQTRSGARQVRMTESQYREVVQELYHRHDEEMRGMLDKALREMVKILDADLQMTITEGSGADRVTITKGVAASDKMNAAKFVWQTVRGKMPENVQVTIDSKPFEQVFEGLARGLSREKSREIRGVSTQSERVTDEPQEGQEPIEAEVVQLGNSERPDRTGDRPDAEVRPVTPEPSDGTTDKAERERTVAALARIIGGDQRTCPDVPRVPQDGTETDLIATQRAEQDAKRKRIAASRQRAAQRRKEGNEDDSSIGLNGFKYSWVDGITDEE